MNELAKIPPDDQKLEKIGPNNYLTVFTRVKLTPYRILDLPDCTIYEFWRGNPKKKGLKEMALLTFNRDKTEFKLSYYPLNGEIQVVKNLGVGELLNAAKDLCDAGFQ